MADPLSITASVAGIASLGYSIAKGLYCLADEMSLAGLEVRVYATEIDSFAKLLLHVQRTVDGLTCSAKEVAEIKSQIKEILDNCGRILKPLQEVQQALLPLLQRFRDSPSKMLQVALRVRWTFVSKGKVLFYRELLQRQHQILDTHLARATLVTLQDKKNTQLVEMLHASLENSVSALNHTVASPGFAQAHAQAQLLLGWHAPEHSPSSFQNRLGGTQSRSSGPVRTGSSQGSTGDGSTSVALIVHSSSPSHSYGPALTGMTEQEVETVLSATSLDIDTHTMTDMEKMLNDTENAERQTIRLVSEILPNTKGRKARHDVKDNSGKRMRSSDALAKCGPEVMGVEWSKRTKRVFRTKQMRFEVLYEVPVLFVSTTKNFRVPRPKERHYLFDGSFFVRPSAYDPKSSVASWLLLWDFLQINGNYLGVQEPAFENALIAGYQVQVKSWDDLPAGLDRPYTSTTISDVIKMAAMLRIHWKEFDSVRHKYSAEGTGFILSSRQVDGLGTVFSLRCTESPAFGFGISIIPDADIEDLIFGAFTTFYGGRLKVGSVAALSDTFSGLGCAGYTVDIFESGEENVGRMFPISFELLGMMCKNFQVESTSHRLLPNPTTHRWPANSFSAWRLLQALRQQLKSLAESWTIRPLDLVLDVDLWDNHRIYASECINSCDKILAPVVVTMRIMRMHFDSLLELARNSPILECEGDEYLGSRSSGSKESDMMDLYFHHILPRVKAKMLLERTPLELEDSFLEIWCILILRMICWLWLHDFHPDDVQLPWLGDMMESTMEVHIV